VWQKLRRVYEPVYCTERARYSGAFWRVAEYPQLIAITVLYERAERLCGKGRLFYRIAHSIRTLSRFINKSGAAERQRRIASYANDFYRAVKNLRFSSSLDYCPPWANRLSIIAERLIGHPTRRLRMFVVYVCYINVYIRMLAFSSDAAVSRGSTRARNGSRPACLRANAAKAIARRPNAGNYDAAYPRCKTALTSATNVR